MVRLPVRVLVVAFAVLLPLVAVPAVATVSGENGRIAFVSGADGDSDIYTVAPDGSDRMKITNAPDQGGFPVMDDDPAWSPDGQSIAFTRTVTTLVASEEVEDRTVWTMASDGSDQQMIAAGYDPSWSPDGGSIAFTMDAVGVVNGLPTTVIAVAELGGGVAIMTDPGDWVSMSGSSTSWDHSPAWTAHGADIVFARGFIPATPISYYTDLMAVAVSSGATTELTPGEAAFGRSARGIDVSPDSQHVVTAQLHFMVPPHRLYIYNIVSQVGSAIDVPDGYDPLWASFAPSGDQLAATLVPFTMDPDEVQTIWTMAVDGSNPTKVTDGWDPVWQPVNPYPFGLVDTSQGQWHLRHVDGQVDSFYFGNPGDVPFMGDWDCDGIDTPGLYRQSDGYVYLRNENTQGNADVMFFFGNPGDMPIAGDFNDDGCDTVSVYRPSNQTFYIINVLGSDDDGLGAADVEYVFGNPGDKPFVADFDGDGVDTVGLHRESTGLVYYINTHSQGVADAAFLFGNPGDRLVANDWNRDGMDSPALFRPGSTTAYFRFTNSQGNADAWCMFGEPAWLPVTGTFELP